MAHCFDRLCLSVAGKEQHAATVDRRGFLFGALGSFAAGTLPSSAGRFGSPAAAMGSAPPGRLSRPGLFPGNAAGSSRAAA